MNATKLIKLAASGLGVALVLAGCGSSSTDNGNSSTGGSSASGGAPGSGGAESSGGESGSGGSHASGGMMGTGGMMDSGGAMSMGGKAMGGMMGAGGMMDSGGAMAMGGMSAGGMGTGGMMAAGGMMGMGGKTGVGAGGMMGMGGKMGAGGMMGMGGTTGAGDPMTLTSPDHADGAKFGTEFTCAAKNGTFGAGAIPELNWDGVPDATNSFAMTFIDTKLGASSAMGQHWAIWNIPKTVRQIPKGTTTLSGDLQSALQTNKYLAPCPSGDDTYEFTLYALSEASLTVSGASGTGTSNSAGVAKVLTALQGVKPLATAVLHGTSGPKGQ